ncbi:MAG: transcription-repair coupling factor [Clostridia bacterium]|nr:transcription-repair coupling factor [Clostridia bacterium]
MSDFSGMISDMSEFKQCMESISGKKTPVHITGMTGSQKSHFIFSVCSALGKKGFVITYDENESGRISRDLSFLFCHEIKPFKSKEYMFYNVDASSHTSEYSRLRSLSDIKNTPCAVASVDAVLTYTADPGLFYEYSFNMKIGDTVDMNDIIGKLVFMGYKRMPSVDGIGQFSVRGSIIDIYSPSDSSAVRIDLFDDEVDSLRFFDVRTQLSTENIDSVTVFPSKELLYDSKAALKAAHAIRQLKNENLYSDADKLENDGYFSSPDKYMPYLSTGLYTVFDYIDDDTVIFLDEAKMLYDNAEVFCKEEGEIISDLMSKGLFPKTKMKYYLDYTDVISFCGQKTVLSISSISHSCPDIYPKALIGITAKSLQNYSGKSEFFYDDIKYWLKMNYRVILVCGDETRISNYINSFYDEGIEAARASLQNCLPPYGKLYIIKGHLEKGFEYPTIKTVVISDADTSRTQSIKIKNKKHSSRDAIKSFEDLSKGDYVVHRSHGIGQYVGIVQLAVDGNTKDYLKIKYKGSDYLYVPTNQLDFLSKYTGSENTHVKINSLGGSQWAKTVSRVRKSVDVLAQDLINLYAERSRLRGHVFEKDTEWQKEFEGKFMYEETEDQLRCIHEVKEDMEQGKCMDRLLCGDVGYGKTEVAIRAAFKCVMDGMQVAYLVPTTILAQQHYNNFFARMSEYAMSVEMLSRFRTKKQQQKTVEGLKNGSVDVVIGTHRLLQKDISFKNLGLLIIDEEQRFGVNHKEKIKEIKKDVDVLTLSATPIPRTLNMAMIGVRDLSVISEPPSDRYPVQTFVMEYNESVVVNAIKREMDRGGQVYYLFNRVDGIEKAAAHIQSMVPDAKVSIAHGQMTENQLESVMMQLLEGEIDVLVCTTIIETGLDVSNVNTIIIENSDKLGLSQLYQLRGRVGRSNRLAYAYLTYRPGKMLDPVAHKRLQAIKEFTEFGSGFKIAMRDLEIRGAGTLLGKQQHGNMNLVGYDMYCMLLEQAVKELKGEKYVAPMEISVDFKEDAYIPESYVEYEQQRIDLYKKIAMIDSIDDYYEIQGEFIDRFGNLPPCIVNLLDIAYIKSLCRKCEITDIVQRENDVVFTFTDNADPDAVVRLVGKYGREMKFVSGEKSKIIYKSDKNVLANTKTVLETLNRFSHSDYEA